MSSGLLSLGWKIIFKDSGKCSELNLSYVGTYSYTREERERETGKQTDRQRKRQRMKEKERKRERDRKKKKREGERSPLFPGHSGTRPHWTLHPHEHNSPCRHLTQTKVKPKHKQCELRKPSSVGQGPATLPRPASPLAARPAHLPGDIHPHTPHTHIYAPLPPPPPPIRIFSPPTLPSFHPHAIHQRPLPERRRWRRYIYSF